jgi:hypothetical protein
MIILLKVELDLSQQNHQSILVHLPLAVIFLKKVEKAKRITFPEARYSVRVQYVIESKKRKPTVQRSTLNDDDDVP